MNKAALMPQTRNSNLAPASLAPPRQGILQWKCACGNHTTIGDECTSCAKKKMKLQRKLTIGASNDPLEQEADRIADQVMATPSHSTINRTPVKIQRVTGNPSGQEIEAPASVKRVLASPGQPLEPTLRRDMESRFGYDFSQVRIHSGAIAEQSARDISALAYTMGHNIVFADGQFAPGTNEGRRLIAHELSHVVQQSEELLPTFLTSGSSESAVVRQAGAPSQAFYTDLHRYPYPYPFNHSRQALAAAFSAQRSARRGAVPSETSIGEVGDQSVDAVRVDATGPSFIPYCRQPIMIGRQRSVLMRLIDPQLDVLLSQIRMIPVPLTPEVKATEIRRILASVNLQDPDNLTPVLATIEATFVVNERGVILTAFLGGIDATVPSRPLPSRGPTPQEEAEMQRRLQMLSPQRRGPYGQYGPGVLLPEISQLARHLVPAVEAIQNALAGAGAFVSGLLEGASRALGPQEQEQLATRLWQSSVLNVIFPSVFAAGAVVGIIEDVIDAVKGIYNLITDFPAFVQGMRDLLSALFGPDGREIARLLGTEIGRDYGIRIAELARSNIFAFTYGVGRMIGPTIVYTVLSLLGVPELLASALITRMMTILRPLLERFPRLLALLEQVAGRLTRVGRHASVDELERDLERSFAATFTEPAGPLRSGASTSRAPELTAGFQAGHLAPLRRLLGRSLTDAQIVDLGQIWITAANPGEAAALTLQNSRRLFDNHRGRFWRRVRQNEAARRLFTDAGFEFTGNATTAPTRTLADGSVMQATIDHIVERQTDPARALDPSNLRIVTRRENTVLLRQLHEQDPFLR